MAAELIGSPVLASEGTEIGAVADISFDEELQPNRLRFSIGKELGLGARTLEIPRGMFTALRGAVVLHIPAEAVKMLPELVDPDDEK